MTDCVPLIEVRLGLLVELAREGREGHARWLHAILKKRKKGPAVLGQHREQLVPRGQVTCLFASRAVYNLSHAAC